MKVIEDVFKHQLRIKNIACYKQNDNIYYIYDFNGYLLNTIQVEDCHWFFQDEKFLQIANNGKIGYFSQDVLVKPLLNYYRPIVNNIGVSHDYTNSDGRIHKESLFHLPEEKQILKEWLPNSIYHIQDQYWCNDTLEDFKLIDAEKGEILWVIPQPAVEKPYGYQGLTNIKKVLGIYKNNLWLQLPDSRVLALDVASGEVKQEVKHFYFSSIPDGIFLDSKGAIIIFHYNIYAEYNLEEMNFTVDHVIGSENDLIIRQVTHHNRDELLYFTGNKNGSFEPNAYGIFNTNTQMFVFLRERAADMGYFYDAPHVNDEIFTILDNKGNLIIHQLKEVLA